MTTYIMTYMKKSLIIDFKFSYQLAVCDSAFIVISFESRQQY